MQTKTYFASSVPAALEVARKELGSEAMLVGSRPAPAELRSLGRLEVTFAFDERQPQGPVPYQPAAPPLSSPSGVTPYSRTELDELRQQIAALRDAVGNNGAKPPVGAAFGDYLHAANGAIEQKVDAAALFVARLCANGLSADTARNIALGAAGKPGEIQPALVDELTARIPVAAFAEMKPGECRTLAFLGPSGRGKTTSLVKIAVQYGLAKRVPVRIYSAGAHGIGGQEQMARYATLLGVPFQAFESLDSLHLALNGDTWKGLVLIDTPGLSRADATEMSAFAAFFTRRAEIEKHLVLRADARTADMLHASSAFSCLSPTRLLFTGLDEALTLGAMAEVLIRTGLPATFAGTGQQIPDDMEEAAAAKWARTVCAGNLLASAAAA